MQKHALVLFSGGLDSMLALAIMKRQGMQVTAVYFTSPFLTSDPLSIKESAERLGVELIIRDITDNFLDIVKRPAFGYGKHMNPCIDCRIMEIRNAKPIMDEIGAGFLVTGEVLNERPMSQRRDVMAKIDKEAGMKGLVLRPLSAKLLNPAIPEEEGIVDRESLYAIEGRSRKPQMALAIEFDIGRYPAPAGGCLLTDTGFSKRMKELMENKMDYTSRDVCLLKYGRHFRLSDKVKIIVGRDEKDDEKLVELAQDGDIHIFMDDIPGPDTLLTGEADIDSIRIAASFTVRYSKARSLDKAIVRYQMIGASEYNEIRVSPADDGMINNYII